MPGPTTIIPKTDASKAKLDVIVEQIAPFMKTVEQATALAWAIAEFAEQAIRDDREAIAAAIRALGETDQAVHFVLTEVLPLIELPRA